IWLKDFQFFGDKSGAVNPHTGVSDKLCKMLQHWCRPGQKLAVEKPEHKSIIEACLGIPCMYDEVVMEAVKKISAENRRNSAKFRFIADPAMDCAPNSDERAMDGVGGAGRPDGCGRAVGADPDGNGSRGRGDCDGGNGGNGAAAARSLPHRSLEYIWSHGDPVGTGFKCNYCNKQIKGGGATRFREHLAGIPGRVTECTKVPKDVREIMKSTRLVGRAKRRAKKNRRLRVEDDIAQIVDVLTGKDSNCIEIPSDEDDDMQVALRRSLKDLNMSRANIVSGSVVEVPRRAARAVVVKLLLKKQEGLTLTWHRAEHLCSQGLIVFSTLKSSKKNLAEHGLSESRRFQERLGSVWCEQYGVSLYGGDTKDLQKYALRVVSQCVSSSGCERNWSSFSLVHTKLRNRLSYAKLHKLVFVHYNLKLAIQRLEVDHQEKVADPFGAMMDVALFDDTNPITDWLNGSMAESQPILDEEDGRPSRELRREVWEASLAGKRKRDKGVKNKRCRKQANEDVEHEYVGSDSDTATPCDVETVYSSSSGNGSVRMMNLVTVAPRMVKEMMSMGMGKQQTKQVRTTTIGLIGTVARSRTAPEICGVEIFWHGNQMFSADELSKLLNDAPRYKGELIEYSCSRTYEAVSYCHKLRTEQHKLLGVLVKEAEKACEAGQADDLRSWGLEKPSQDSRSCGQEPLSKKLRSRN
ncbi:hypothetical protein EJB05_54632, partial [Eragrostis curvula]